MGIHLTESIIFLWLRNKSDMNSFFSSWVCGGAAGSFKCLTDLII